MSIWSSWVRAGACAGVLLGFVFVATAGADEPCPVKLQQGVRQPVYSSPEMSAPVVGSSVPIWTTPTAPTTPSNLVLPSISGTPKVGSTLTAAPGTWAGASPFTFTWAWVRCLWECSPITGADSATYTVTRADAVTT